MKNILKFIQKVTDSLKSLGFKSQGLEDHSGVLQPTNLHISLLWKELHSHERHVLKGLLDLIWKTGGLKPWTPMHGHHRSEHWICCIQADCKEALAIDFPSSTSDENSRLASWGNESLNFNLKSHMLKSYLPSSTCWLAPKLQSHSRVNLFTEKVQFLGFFWLRSRPLQTLPHPLVGHGHH